MGLYTYDINNKLNNTNCYLSKRKIEILSKSQQLQKLSIKRLDSLNFQILFKNCSEFDFFLVCDQRKYLSLSFFPINKIEYYFDLPDYVQEYLVLTDIFRSHNSIIFKEEN